MATKIAKQKKQNAAIRLGTLQEFIDRYKVKITATEIGIFRVQINHIDESNNQQNARVSLSDIQDGPFKTRQLL